MACLLLLGACGRSLIDFTAEELSGSSGGPAGSGGASSVATGMGGFVDASVATDAVTDVGTSVVGTSVVGTTVTATTTVGTTTTGTTSVASSGVGGGMSSSVATTTATSTTSTASSSSSGGGPTCPAMQPKGNCSPVGLNCAYGSNQCTCEPGGWLCNGCPANAPMNGSTCNGQQMPSVCDYGAYHCACFQGSWHCATCPGMQPNNGSNCNTNGLNCPYNTQSCTCFNFHWQCSDYCPASQPMPGQMCNVSPFNPCTYNGKTCLCIQKQFFCN